MVLTIIWWWENQRKRKVSRLWKAVTSSDALPLHPPPHQSAGPVAAPVLFWVFLGTHQPDGGFPRVTQVQLEVAGSRERRRVIFLVLSSSPHRWRWSGRQRGRGGALKEIQMKGKPGSLCCWFNFPFVQEPERGPRIWPKRSWWWFWKVRPQDRR